MLWEAAGPNAGDCLCVVRHVRMLGAITHLQMWSLSPPPRGDHATNGSSETVTGRVRVRVNIELLDVMRVRVNIELLWRDSCIGGHFYV